MNQVTIAEELRETADFIEADINTDVVYKVKELREFLLDYRWEDFHKALMKAYAAIIEYSDMPLDMRSYFSVMLKERDPIGLKVIKPTLDVEWSKLARKDLKTIILRYSSNQWQDEFVKRGCKAMKRVLLSKTLYDKVYKFISNPKNFPFESELVPYSPPKAIREEWIKALFDSLNDRKEVNRRFSELLQVSNESRNHHGRKNEVLGR